MITELNEQQAEIERFRKLYADEGLKAMVLLEENSRLKAEIERLRKGLAAVENLIGDSSGVYGLHQNGDPAPWIELRTGGRFEGWLADFDMALEEMET